MSSSERKAPGGSSASSAATTERTAGTSASGGPLARTIRVMKEFGTCSCGQYSVWRAAVSSEVRRTSPTTPTTSASRSLPHDICTRFPIASSPGQKSRASARFTSTTGGRSFRSLAVRSRPASSGTPIVRSAPGVMMRMSATGSWPRGGTGRSRTRKVVAEPSPMGVQLIAPADCAPGICARRSTASRTKAACRSGVSYFACGRSTGTVSTPWGRNPASTWARFQKLRSSSPVPAVSTSERATSETTSAFLSLRCARLAPRTMPPSFRDGTSAGRDCWRAGTRPNTIALASDRPAVKPTTAGSRPMRVMRRTSAGSIATRACRTHAPSTSPAAPPASASSRLSARSCRTRRPGLAPSAERIATSRSRPTARASRRLATLAQPTRSSSATAPTRTTRAGLTSRTRSACSGNTVVVHPVSKSGFSRARRAASVFISSRAWPSVTSGLSRPTTVIQRPRALRMFSFMVSASHIAAPAGSWKSCGITPTTVNGRPLTVMARPTMAGSAPKRRRHRPSETTATSGAPGTESASRSVRPR